MEKYTDEKIEIANPSQLVIRVDEYLKLSRKLPSQNESLMNRERQIFDSLGNRTKENYSRIIFTPIDMSRVEQEVNTRYKDGIYLEDDLDTITYPYDRTIRTRPAKLDDPTKVKVQEPKEVPPLRLGNYRIIRDNPISIQRFTTPLLALEDTFESSNKRR